MVLVGSSMIEENKTAETAPEAPKELYNGLSLFFFRAGIEANNIPPTYKKKKDSIPSSEPNFKAKNVSTYWPKKYNTNIFTPK